MLMSYLVKGKPFVFKGTIDVSDCETAAEVMKKASLDWTVAKTKVYAEMPFIEDSAKNSDTFIQGADIYTSINNAYAIYRTDKNIPLGLVKSQYTPVQNIEAFNFFDNAIGKDKAIFQTAGCFGFGERIFVSVKLPNDILVNGDPVENYLVFTTSHDGSSGVKILFTPIRVVCENTLNAAIQNTSNYVSFKHSKNVHYNIDIASEILGICKTKSNNLQLEYEAMAKLPVKDRDAKQIFAEVVFTEDELNKIKNNGNTLDEILSRNYIACTDNNLSMKKINTFIAIVNYYNTGIGQKEILGTQWGVYNAISGYYSNVFNVDSYKRMDSLLYGYGADKIKLGGNIITSLAS